ncbi:DNA primase family protein [Rhodocyclaceae bacterium SMB388]
MATREDEVLAKFGKRKPAVVQNIADAKPGLAADSTHYQVADHWLERVTAETGCRPIHTQGTLWRLDPNDKLWKPMSMDALAADLGRRYSAHKLCRRQSDYKQIAAVVGQIAGSDDFFSCAPAGIAAAGKFWSVSESGEIRHDLLTAEHRQRMQVVQPPEFEAGAPLFEGLLSNAFGPGVEGDGQRELLQMGLGAALTRQLWRHRIVLLLYGKTSTGKSTTLEIFRALFPLDMIGATSPQNWASEYYVAALAGKQLNIVGELDPHTPIPGGPFKAVTGGDVVEGRHPTHRPFTFVCEAAHIFNCNRLPPTRDKSDAFFRRFRILEFRNPIAVGSEITGLAERINAEEQGAVLGWLLDGAAKLAQRGTLPETKDHKDLIDTWRSANNSALQFLNDAEFCETGVDLEQPAAHVFESYRKWASTEGVKPLGRSGFYEAIADGAGRFGVTIFDDRNKVRKVKGLSLKKEFG